MEQLLILVAVFLAVVCTLALRRRIFSRMAVRNIARRKKYSAIVVCGLLVATAMISSSLVMGDTLDYIITRDVLVTTGSVDIEVYVTNEKDEIAFFNYSVFNSLQANVAAGMLPHVDGVSEAIRDVLAVQDTTTGKSFSRAGLFGYDYGNHVNPILNEDGTGIFLTQVTEGASVINRALADELDAVVGDTIVAITRTGSSTMLQVSAVAAEGGMADWGGSPLVFVELSFSQQMMGQPGMINRIDVSCAGSDDEGYLNSDEAIEELGENLPSGNDYTFDPVKQDGMENAEAVASQVSQIFMLMSSFAIVAGIALIINIFVMLAEERKTEMGISRAIGMQRRDLTQTFLFEGIIYALIAAGVGSFAGLAIAFFIMSASSSIISGGLSFALHFKWTSLVIAACAGFLVTALTVLIASWRVSKLNIVRAIRDIPEPIIVKSQRRYLALGVASVVFGLLVTIIGDAERSAAGVASGPCILALGGAMISARFFKPRIPFTLAGLWAIFWMIDPWNLSGYIFGEVTGSLEMFVISGLLMVTGAVIVIMFNSDILLKGLMSTFGRKKSLLPVFKTAVSYPMNKKFRTGLTLFIFALIVFTVVVVAMIASFQRESVTKTTEHFSGGFEIIGFSMIDIPRANMSAGSEEVNGTVGPGAVRGFSIAANAPITLTIPETGDSYDYSLVGFDATMMSEARFSLMQKAPGYESDADVWASVAENTSLVIVDGAVVPSQFGTTTFNQLKLSAGQTISIETYSGNTANVTIAGIMDQSFINGLFTSIEHVRELSPGARENVYYIDTAPPEGTTNAAISEELDKQFLEYGLTTIVIRDTIEELMSMVSSVMQLMEIFLGVGLVVGISGLGIITIRNVAERRQEIGVMRAIGYQRDMILKSFLVETSFISLLGIITGVVLGLSLSFLLFDWGGFSELSDFVIPWTEIIGVLLIAFAFTLLATLPPSRKAARLAPAEALRRID